MSVTHMEILGSVGEKLPMFPLDRTRDALASFVQVRWPVGRRKAVAKEWGLSADEARSICEASASQATLDKVWRHERGGWAVAIPVLGAVIGMGLDDFIATQRSRHVEHARRSRALVRDLRALASDRPDALRELGDRRRIERRPYGG